MRVLVLGSNGMLGSRLLSVFKDQGIEVYSTSRYGGLNSRDWPFDVASGSLDHLLREQRLRPTYIINAIGLIKPRINESDGKSIRRAIQVNSEFPHLLAELAARVEARVLQIATDCVYSGQRGGYLESSPHDALDVYGKTKSLGEVASENVMHIRSSIIGPEIGRSSSLWEWVRGQPPNGTIGGFTTHLWNGVTTDAFSEVCLTIIRRNLFLAGKLHLIPANTVTKFELVKRIAVRCGLLNLNVEPQEVHPIVDRTLGTENGAFNQQLWRATDYKKVPTIEEMINLVRND